MYYVNYPVQMLGLVNLLSVHLVAFSIFIHMQLLFSCYVQLWLQTLFTSLYLYVIYFPKKKTKQTINKVKDEFD